MVAFGVEQDKASFNQAQSAISGLKSFAKKVLGGIALAIGFQNLNQFKAECVELASNLEQVQQKFNVVYGGEGSKLANNAEQWAKQYADTVGRNTNTIKQYMADNQNLITGFIGTSAEAREEAAKLTQQMVESALDLASFNNIADDEAVYAMSKAMMGESEAAKRLGAVLNDVTRAQAMEELGLKGKYQALSQAEKMQVNYRAIMDQSQDSIGDCVRSMASYESQQRQLNAKVREYKEYLGTMLLPVQNIFVGLQVKAVKWITELTKKIIGENAEENRLVKVYEYFMGLIKRFQPVAERFATAFSKGMKQVGDFIKDVVDKAQIFIDKMGGIENAMKLIAIVATAIGIAVGALKIYKFIKDIELAVKVMTALKNIFSLTTLKVIGLIAVIVIIALIIEDFINFMQGNDSVIGTLFDKAGIGADNARDKIIEGWGKIKQFLSDTWNFLKQTGQDLFKKLSDFITEHKDVFDAVLEALYVITVTVFGAIKNFIITTIAIVMVIFDALKAFWENWGDTIKAYFSVLWETLGGFIDGFLNVIKGIAEFVSGVLTGDWKKAWQGVYDIFVGIGEMIKNFVTGIIVTMQLVIEIGLSAIKSLFTTILNAIAQFIAQKLMEIHDFWTSIWEAVKAKADEVWNNILTAILAFLISIYAGVVEKITSVKNTIIENIEAACLYIKSLPEKAFQWGLDFINGLANGIRGGMSNITGAITGIGDKIKANLHFSVPDEGPLTTYQQWMPDFMKGLAASIKLDKSNPVFQKIQEFAIGVARLSQSGIASSGTIGASSYLNQSRSITQNVNIDNTYSGGTVETQRNVSKAMRKSATDATTAMARGLQFARG